MTLFTYHTRVLPEWVDYNGHMRDAFYVLVFSIGIDTFMDDIGIDEHYRFETGGTLYSLETHQFYLKEVGEGAPLRIETRFLDVDKKRLHVWQALYHNDTNELLAIQESLQFHVVQHDGTVAAAPFPDTIQHTVDTHFARHRELEPPAKRAGSIGIRR